MIPNLNQPKMVYVDARDNDPASDLRHKVRTVLPVSRSKGLRFDPGDEQVEEISAMMLEE